ncbi:hypothetical protein [Mycolicibacterium sarraceniae]|uniref:hypothetical protein n=1 Tax=Mycolicibacterium sarraceniae TaxID=1534348 RepID=UPI001C660932|nr:hypothetical protein [Mycolicibacterium sarraceniae]
MNSPLVALAVAPSPIPIAIVVRLLIQPLPLLNPKAEKHDAWAGGGAANAPAASALETNAPSNALLFLAPTRPIKIPCNSYESLLVWTVPDATYY